MKDVSRIVLAALGAVLAQPLLFIAWVLGPELLAGKPVDLRSELPWLVLAPVMVAGVFVCSFGIPVFALLRSRGRLSFPSLALAGFLLPALPLAVLLWPSYGGGHSRSGSWYGTHVSFVVDGVPTVYAWLSYAQTIATAGLHGLLGALVFLWIWRRMGGDTSPAERTG